MRRRWYAAPAAALVLALSLAGCGGDDDEPDENASGSPSQSASDSGSASTSEEGDSPDPSASSDPSEPTENILDWEKSEVSNETRIAGTDTELRLPQSGAKATITGAGDSDVVVPAGKGRRITDAFLTEKHAVVIAQDKTETRPQAVTIVDLASGKKSTLGDPAPGTGGPWAMAGTQLAYATYTPGSDYCLATYDVAADSGQKGFCAKKGHGFSNVSVTPHGLAMMSFDNKRPVSCRTLVTVDGTQTTPIEGVPECKGWEAMATESGAIWSILPNENQVERGEFHATVDGETVDLGPGSASTLTWCGDSAYFARDASKGKPAQLLRWTPQDTLEVVYESPGKGQGFLSPPACGGGVLTVSAYSEGGDERVTATVPQ